MLPLADPSRRLTSLAAWVLGVCVSASACDKADKQTTESPETAAAPSTGGAGAVTVVTATYNAEANVPDKVKEECELDVRLPEYVAEFTAGTTIAADASGVSGPLLTLDIVEMLGTGGGVYSGPKYMTVAGQLSKDGVVVGSFRARRTTTGGMFGGYKGTCSLLGRTARAIGKDIGGWLVQPTMDARLGELQ